MYHLIIVHYRSFSGNTSYQWGFSMIFQPSWIMPRPSGTCQVRVATARDQHLWRPGGSDWVRDAGIEGGANHGVVEICACLSQNITGWWLTYPSEKFEFVNWDDYSQLNGENKKKVPNHQPDNHLVICYIAMETGL